LIELVEYANAAGVSPYTKWLETLDGTTQGRILASTLRLAAGNFSAVKGAGAGIYR
jgi:putative component of toxin-antitoxin plasmid stabilization module